MRWRGRGYKEVFHRDDGLELTGFVNGINGVEVWVFFPFHAHIHVSLFLDVGVPRERKDPDFRSREEEFVKDRLRVSDFLGHLVVTVWFFRNYWWFFKLKKTEKFRETRIIFNDLNEILIYFFLPQMMINYLSYIWGCCLGETCTQLKYDKGKTYIWASHPKARQYQT